MKKVVKMFVILTVMAMSVMTVSAQTKGDMAVGGNVIYAIGEYDYSNIGLGAKFQYNIMDPLRLEGGFNYLLKKDNISFWDLSAYAHYLFNVADKINVYPIAGIGILGAKSSYSEGSDSNTKLAISLGAGIDYSLTEKLALTADYKYKIVDNSNFSFISVGIAYKL